MEKRPAMRGETSPSKKHARARSLIHHDKKCKDHSKLRLLRTLQLIDYRLMSYPQRWILTTGLQRFNPDQFVAEFFETTRFLQQKIHSGTTIPLNHFHGIAYGWA